MLATLGGKTANARAHIDTKSHRVDIAALGSRTEPRLGYSLLGCCYGIDGEFVLLACKAWFDAKLLWLKIFYLARNLYG